MKRLVQVTITKEIEIEIMPSVFGPMTEAEYLAEFSQSFFKVGSLDDIFKYAAVTAAQYGNGECEGLGFLGERGMVFAKAVDVIYDEQSADVETEFLSGPEA